MGLSLPLISALSAICDSHRVEGSLLALGVQSIRADGASVARVISTTRGVPSGALPSAPRDRDVYRALGFARTTSVDLYPDEAPDRIVDLAMPLPEDMRGAFDAFLDSGTLEHIFDVRAAFVALIDALRPGGIAIHISPLGGFENHGFYQFGPKLFARVYAANGFRDLQAWSIALTTDDNVGAIAPIVDFDAPLRMDPKSYRSLLAFAARKVEPRAFTTPVDTHLADLGVPGALALAARDATLARLVAAGFPREIA